MARTLQANQVADAIVAAPGQVITLTDGYPSSQIVLGASPTLVIPETGFLSFEVSVSGTFVVVVSIPLYSSADTGNGGGGQFKAVFDEGESNEQTVGDTVDWQTYISANEKEKYPLFIASIDLDAGTHTVKVYGTKSGGATTGIRVLTGDLGSPTITLLSVTGSGAGGTLLDDAAGSESTPQTVSSVIPTWTDLTDLTHTVETSANDDVVCIFSGQLRSTTGASNPHVALVVNGTRERIIADNINASTVTRSMSFVHVLTPGAGSHVVKLQAGKLSGDSDFTVEPTPITGTHEDSPHFQVLRIRGGLVPVQENGVTKIGTPAALNFGAGFSVVENGGAADITANTNWRYLDAVNLPTSSGSFEALWQFDGSGSQYNDRTANGHDGTTEGGTMLQTAIDGMVGIASQDTSRISVALPAGLRTTGAVTVVALAAVDNVAGENSVLVQVGNPAAGSASNINYMAAFSSDTVSPYAVHQYGTKQTEIPIFSAMGAINEIAHYVYTRTADGLTWECYMDGTLMDSITVSNAPTDGSNGLVYLLGAVTGGVWVNFFRGAVFCIGILKEKWSAAQVLESYRFCRKLV